MKKLKFIYNDGGRKEAGYKGHTGDCVCRSIAIATGKPYKEVYDELNQVSKDMGKYYVHHLKETAYGNSYVKASHARTGVQKKVYDKYIKTLGWKWQPTMGIGTGCQVHLLADELPDGNLIVCVSKHMTAVIDGELHDTYDCSRDGTRCVYGFYYKPKSE